MSLSVWSESSPPPGFGKLWDGHQQDQRGGRRSVSVSVCAGKRHPRPRQRGQARSLQVPARILMNPTGVKGHRAQNNRWTKDSCEEREDWGERRMSQTEFIVYLMSFQSVKWLIRLMNKSLCDADWCGFSPLGVCYVNFCGALSLFSALYFCVLSGSVSHICLLLFLSSRADCFLIMSSCLICSHHFMLIRVVEKQKFTGGKLGI